jgi:hypothetical protein
MESYAEYIYKMIFVRFETALAYEMEAYQSEAIEEAAQAEIAEMEKMAAYYQYEFCR